MTKNYQEFKKISQKWKLLLATDIVVFSYFEKKLKILLIKRKYDPNKGQWAIPGGFVREDENLEQAALRELKEETGITNGVYLEQLYTFGEVDRDPRDRIISTAYLVLINDLNKFKLEANDDASEAKWFDFDKLPKLAFGKAHKDILMYAKQRLKWKFEYTNISTNLLPPNFTLTELQKLYETILETKLDKRNFRKKILSIDLVEPIDDTKKEMGRPAQLYKSANSKTEIYPKII